MTFMIHDDGLHIRQGFDNNLTDYMSETSIAHAFHHNTFLVVSNGDVARYGSITSKWEQFLEWKRNASGGLSPHSRSRFGSLRISNATAVPAP